MTKKVLAATAATASPVGISATVAPQAMAIGGHHGTSTVNGNRAKSAFGYSTTHGRTSPQPELIQGSPNKPGIGFPAEADVGSSAGSVPVTVQGLVQDVARDVDVPASPRNRQCAEHPARAKGGEALSPTIDDIPIRSDSGVRNR
ncbi:rodlin [Streptomyces sp. GS7]|uniref:rodlin n=1 Tax=Streptomyces sp. GS7 TaxID=2692234 RepID=UPI001318D442|nr:rodlin [Streptomyces sp. GS7]QHC26199.1 RdlA protein [Streptomyces sp. GS7]